jgi:5-oxoprolinase (ATP-hydrolysing) subunit A
VTTLQIDLNADLGEGYGRWTLGDDEALLDVVTSANVACGYHAGDPTVMRTICALAAERDVAVGAQVAYHDLAGFGRRFVDVAPHELANDVIYQIGALDAFARIAGTRVSYVKPHGALYHAVAHHEGQARALVEAVCRYDPTLAVLGLPGSAWLRLAAEAGLTTVTEAFADRAYTPAGGLVPRSEDGAVLEDADAVADRSVRLACAGEVEAVDGTVVAVRAGSVCVHGDNPRAVAMARAVRTALTAAGVRLAPFTGGGGPAGGGREPASGPAGGGEPAGGPR